MTIDELAKDILKKEDDKIARAFTMVVGSLLLSKGIQPIINKSSEVWNANDDLSKYIIRKEYKVTFDLDTTEHDAKVRADAIDEFVDALKQRAEYLSVGVKSVEHSLILEFENIAEQLKGE